MTRTVFNIILFFPWWGWAQSSSNITLLDNWHSDSLVTNSTMARYNNCFGYAQNGEEYAIIGSTEGTHYFHIQDNKLVPKGFVRGNYSHNSVVHRDIKTYKNYAYAVCDEGPSKLQIIDLSYLPDSVHLAIEHATDFGRVHTIFIDSVNALLYACMVTPIVGGNPTSQISMRVFSIADPLYPVMVYQGPNDIQQVHECYVRNGIAFLNCGYDGLRIYDFSTPSSPQLLQTIDVYQDQGYNHQGWLTPDGKNYFFGDETMGKRIKQCSVSESKELTLERRFGTNYLNNSVAHNMMASNEYLFVAYYNEGLRIYSITNNLEEVAHYDTYPEEYFYKQNGAWGVYSELPSERLLVSDRQSGLYLFDFNRTIFQHIPQTASVYPNVISSGNELTVQLDTELTTNFETSIWTTNGQVIKKDFFSNVTYGILQMDFPAGIYFVTISFIDYLGDEILLTKKIIITN